MFSTADATYRIAFALLALLGFGGSIYLRRRADEAAGEVPRSADPPGIVVALRVGGGVYYGALLLWLLHPPIVGWARLPVSSGFRWLGLLLAVLGTSLAVWSLWHLGRNVTPTSVTREDARLVRTGPYRWVRHPLYSSMVLTIPGLSLLSANALVLAGGVATFVTILVRLDVEERNLLEHFGEAYRRYMERTGRIFPDLRR